METKDPVKLWNKAIKSLLQAKEDWSELQLRMIDRPNLDSSPIKAQKLLSLATVTVGFEIAIPRLIDYYRVSGGLEELLIEEPPEEEKEVKDVSRKQGRRL